jgi:hypothetical protein
MRLPLFPQLVLIATVLQPALFAIGQPRYIEDLATHGSFPLVQAGAAAPLYADPNDYPGVLRAAKDVQADIARVTGRTPALAADAGVPGAHVVVAGTLGRNRLIDRLVRDGRLDTQAIAGKWEAFLVQVVAKPWPGTESALVIAGSDQRGAIYGLYSLSEQIGVSPWYWWADVPVRHRNSLFVRAGRYLQAPPAVKYRGISLDSEAPALSGWVREKFGGYNSRFYAKVFELLLRMKGNCLWPAMGDSGFNEDDPLNPQLAGEYGVVVGTAHHGPERRAFWTALWTDGVARNKAQERIVALGGRGDGGLPMDGEANLAQLERIVAGQRRILAEKVNPNVKSIPQLWALYYKEEQESYEKGMRVPEDVTLLWSDDNWGNLRRLPTPDERHRSGGAGIYYHFDSAGGPRHCSWIDTNPIAKVAEQMTLAYRYGADRIWIISVGDLKPMEFPTEFFLHLAWDPARWPKEKVPEYTRLWAEREFGREHAAGIAGMVTRYTCYTGRRKPQLLEPGTYSVVNYDEAGRAVADFDKLVRQAERMSARLPESARAAFFELVLHPIKAAAQVTELYAAAAKNRLYAAQGRAATNGMAARARALLQADAELSAYYNHKLLGGKWNHLMDRQPPENILPALKDLELPAAASPGVAIEGSELAWPGAAGFAELPAFDVYNQPRRWIEVFNRGRAPFEFAATVSEPWIVLSAPGGKVHDAQRLWVTVDWKKVPLGVSDGFVEVAPAGGSPAMVKVIAINPQQPTRESLSGFIQANGYVAVEAAHYTHKTAAGPLNWEKLPDYGRTLSAMAVYPLTERSLLPPTAAPCLEYRMYLFSAGKVEVEAVLSPTLNFVPGRGLRYAISFDGEPPQVIDALEHNSLQDWETAVKDSVRKAISTHTIAQPGYHTLKFRMVDPAVVLERIVVNLGGVKASYLGPPESYRGTAAAK